MKSTMKLAATAAATLLGAAGAVHAATVGTGTVVQNGATTGALTSASSGTGSGVLDDGGTFTMNLTETTKLFGSPTTVTATDVFTGTYGTGVFTPSAGSTTINTCTGSAYCSAALGTTPFTTVGGSLTLAGGVLTGQSKADNGAVTSSETYTVGAISGGSPPPVPLPPAVWLLGSGLLGLVGTARRRRKA